MDVQRVALRRRSNRTGLREPGNPLRDWRVGSLLATWLPSIDDGHRPRR